MKVTAVSVHKEELIKFWKSSASGSGSRNSFEGFFNIANVFPQFNSHLLKNWSDLRENFITDVSAGKEIPITPTFLEAIRIQIWTGFASVEVCILRALLCDPAVGQDTIRQHLKTFMFALHLCIQHIRYFCCDCELYKCTPTLISHVTPFCMLYLIAFTNFRAVDFRRSVSWRSWVSWTSQRTSWKICRKRSATSSAWLTAISQWTFLKDFLTLSASTLILSILRSR